MLLLRNKYRSYDDSELITLYKERQRPVILGEFYQRYAHLVMGTAMKYLKNVHEAEDLTMNLFEKLPAKLIQHEIKHFKSWLYMVTKNECLMLLRKTRNVVDAPHIEAEDSSEDAPFDITDEMIESLRRTINELKEPQLSCIKLFYMEQKSYVEISGLLHLDIKTVKSAIQNGKRNLKIKLENSHEK